jgi:uncharacterized membrane protein
LPARWLSGGLKRVELKQAALKTITFRVVVTSLDFSFNYIVLGSVSIAAGLSGLSLVAGPFFYFMRETIWTWLRARERDEASMREPLRFAGFTMSGALAKTITYRVMATTAEFTTNHVVVGDLATAVLLSSFGFVLGPFIYYAHERVWERFGDPADAGSEPNTPKLLPPPAPRLTYAGLRKTRLHRHAQRLEARTPRPGVPARRGRA